MVVFGEDNEENDGFSDVDESRMRSYFFCDFSFFIRSVLIDSCRF